MFVIISSISGQSVLNYNKIRKLSLSKLILSNFCFFQLLTEVQGLFDFEVLNSQKY